MIISEFQKEFNSRHDFQYEDMNFLPMKYPSIVFENIPEAWVCQIDLHIEDIYKKISSISQVMGFLVVNFRNGSASEADYRKISCLNNKIISIDIDLHKKIKSGILTH